MGTTRTVIGKVGVTPKGDYNQGQVYDKLDVVRYGGDSYMSKVPLNSSLPTDTSKWMPQTEHSRIVEQNSNTATIMPDVLNSWSEVSFLNITLSPAISGKTAEYMLEFTVDSDSFTFSCEGVKWPDNEEPDWENGYTYQVSILNGLALYAEWEALNV